MTLTLFLAETKQTPSAFARKIGVSRQQMAMYASGGQIPRKDVMRKIVEATSGLVRPDDFYGLPRESAK